MSAAVKALADELRASQERVKELEAQTATAVCAFCLQVLEKKPELMAMHMVVCEKHPIKWAMLKIDELEAAIRKHRDQRGDDRCWQDDEALYAALPEGHTPPAREVAVELANCERYIRCRRNPATEYVSPQRRIEELEAERLGLIGIIGGLDALAYSVITSTHITGRYLDAYRELMARLCAASGRTYEDLHGGRACP